MGVSKSHIESRFSARQLQCRQFHLLFHSSFGSLHKNSPNADLFTFINGMFVQCFNHRIIGSLGIQICCEHVLLCDVYIRWLECLFRAVPIRLCCHMHAVWDLIRWVDVDQANKQGDGRGNRISSRVDKSGPLQSAEKMTNIKIARTHGLDVFCSLHFRWVNKYEAAQRIRASMCVQFGRLFPFQLIEWYWWAD